MIDERTVETKGMSKMKSYYYFSKKKNHFHFNLCVYKSQYKTYLEYNALVGIYCKLIHFSYIIQYILGLWWDEHHLETQLFHKRL